MTKDATDGTRGIARPSGPLAVYLAVVARYSAAAEES